MAQKYSEAQKQSARKWDAANLDRLSLALPKGSREAIKAHATAQGESTNAFIKRAIDCQMARDGAGGPQEAAGEVAGDGGISLPSDALESVQQAAERTGEAPAVFVARAIETQAKRDRNSLKLGINPVTGDKLDSKGGADHE